MLMPENYIIDRLKHENNGDTQEWWNTLKSLSEKEYEETVRNIKSRNFNIIEQKPTNKKIVILMGHYGKCKTKKTFGV